MVFIGKATNDISINGLEWLLNENDKPMRFIDGNTAKQFLLDNGENTENIYAYWFENEKTGIRLNVE